MKPITITNAEVYKAITESIELRWKKIVEAGGETYADIPSCQLCYTTAGMPCDACPIGPIAPSKSVCAPDHIT